MKDEYDNARTSQFGRCVLFKYGDEYLTDVVDLRH